MERKVSEGNGRKAEVKARETERRGGRKRERDLLKRERRGKRPPMRVRAAVCADYPCVPEL